MQARGASVTFLFTDIERSSQLWETHPRTMGRSLAQHDELMRAAITENGGHIFKTVGDAFCVVFENTLDAVHAAIAAQRRLSAAAWEETGPLRVRMALHSGEAEQRDNDYFGPTLNRVARVLAAGHGGQTLLSFVAAERVRERLPAEISLRDLGERRLKDLNRPERIFQLIVLDLPTDFPPLRSLEVLPNNLPAQVTTFVGRGKEMAQAKLLLGTTRLLTLTGPGGTGKTRLSLQVAADVLDRFPHGVWLIELATISDPALVPEAIANAVEIREEHGRSAAETLVAALRPRQLLLVLDNCEHLIGACAQMVAQVLRRCPGVKVLASSREALNIEGETICPVPPLATMGYQELEAGVPMDELAGLEAVQLFVERAAAVRPGFSLTPENALLLARICWRLDGIPLAIELAAARVKVLTLDQILERLDNRFRLLSGGSRAALPRQQTLGALIDWSYDLLSEPERILLRRLSVFVAGRTVEMAETVCAGEGVERDQVFDLLNALVEKSLLMVEPGLEGENRFTMLESVWDYAEEKLVQHQEAARYRRKHLEYFVAFAERGEPGLMGPQQRAWLEKLSGEQYNLNVAVRFSLEQPDTIELGLRLVGALTRYWEVHSYLTEGYAQFQPLLAKADPSVPKAIRAKAELGAARLSWSQDRDPDARRHYHTALELYRDLGAREQMGIIEAQLGFTERNDGNPAKAREHLERARTIGEELHSVRVLGTVDSGLGSLAGDEGDFATASAAKERSLVAFRSLGDQWVVALITGSLARACYQAGDYAAARTFVREALLSLRDLGNKWAVPYAIEGVADICAREGDGAKAVRLYGAASAQRESLALSFSKLEQAAYARAMDRLHELVTEEVFVHEWHQGRTLSFAAAIELATK
jgi:predicted ATPase/class 3 adenylate cyclase